MPPKTDHFSIHASVVFQLGENLITDATQALLELVNNSYDADASYCKVTIETQVPTDHGVGRITIEDDGIGMGEEDIKRGWLTISDSLKKEFKRQGKKTERGRTPLGDKGLGRLGTQRLGGYLQIRTRKNDNMERVIDINWDDFVTTKLLEQVPVLSETRASSEPRGTTLTICGLRDIEIWRATGKESLTRDLSQVISPYRPIKDFDVVPKFDGEELDLFEIGSKLRNTALLTYTFDYKAGVLIIRGKAKLDYIRPDKGKKEKILFQELVEHDGGNEFFTFLRKEKGESLFEFGRCSGKWWVEYGCSIALEDIDKAETVGGTIADPGDFSGEADHFSFSQDVGATQKVFTDAAQYRSMVQSLSGIRIYRDGFAIRVAKDWLELGSQWTSAPSYYGLKPQNTIGYIAISAYNNHCLVEKTDREGFSDNAHYRNFGRLLTYFVEYAGNAQEFLRRGWSAFKSHKARVAAKLTPSTTPEELNASLSATLARAATYRLALSRAGERLKDLASRGAALRESASTQDGPMVIKQYTDLVRTLDAATDEARRLITDVDEYLRELSIAEKMAKVLAEQLEQLREQMRQVHEVMALGLTAEALSHEIGNIASDLATRNDQILKYLRSSGGRDARLIAYAQHVKTTISGLRKELSYLAPSFQYVREKRDDFDLNDLLSELVKHHFSRFSSERIGIRVQRTGGKPFRVRVNKGKMIQVLDNIFLNAEYWLKEDMRLNRIAYGTINVELKRPLLLISDNGRGIDPKLEDTVFEPFVTGKGKGKGRGLGLFIVQQLLASEGCLITLKEERNQFDRKSIFELDLGGILID